MPDPQIRYCTAEDGVAIAYWTMGDGPTLVMTPPGPVGHIAGELLVDDIRGMYERLARSFTVLRYDPRGGGSSQRDLVDTHATRVIDLGAALRVAPNPPAHLFASSTWAGSAIEVAATVPEIVERLICWQGYATGDDYRPSSRLTATRALAPLDWGAYTDAWAQSGHGWRRSESARQWSRWLRTATTPDAMERRFASFYAFDVTGLLAQVRATTLAVDFERGGLGNPDAARRIAAGIPGARLMMLPGVGFPFSMDIDNRERHASLIEEFLGVSSPQPAPAAGIAQTGSGTTVILFVDIAGSTALTERMGDAAFRTLARDLDGAMREIVRGHGGATIDAKTLGDGILATFPAASQAIGAALACGEAGTERGLPLHLGIHAGDVIREDDNVFGGAVNIAARISALSAPGKLLVSRTVADLARTSAGVTFEDRGEHALKGIEHPIAVFAVRLPDGAAP